MIVNFFKISWRKIRRDKWFSAINIFGLGISLILGLVMVSILFDVLSYDRFHHNANQIYRIITTRQHGEAPPKNYASSSISAGLQIRETIPGIEKMTTLEGGFSEDVQIGEKSVPLEGIWADNSFLKVFSFPLNEGNLNSALKEPYSVVLTESAAKKLFDTKKAIGSTINIGGLPYQVTGIVNDVPKASHLRFDLLISFSTKQILESKNEEWAIWPQISAHYTYIVISKTAKLENIQIGLDKICERENLKPGYPKIKLSLQALQNIVTGPALGNEIGLVFPSIFIWILVGLTLIVIFCAIFNYTSLSLARFLNRGREIGVRKVIGASKKEIFFQFLSEAIVIALFSFVIAFLIFLMLRPQILHLNPALGRIISLSLSPVLILYFIVLTLSVGIIAGIIPAFIFSKLSLIESLKNTTTTKGRNYISLRKALFSIQYTFSLLFVALTIIGYNQYQHFVYFDLGFKTAHIVNIDLQGKRPDVLINELNKIPEIIAVGQSAAIISPDSYSKTLVKFGANNDSLEVDLNEIDENYLTVHEFKFLAGKNFQKGQSQNAVIVNQQFLKAIGISDKNNSHAIGKVVFVNGKPSEIVGLVKDFHYGGVEKTIGPYLFINSKKYIQYVNVKLAGSSISNWDKIQKAWYLVDKTLPMKANYYSEQIKNGFKEIVVILKLIGFFSFLTISIALLGLLGIVVFSTKSRIKEIGIRKVFGSSISTLIYLLSKQFILLFIFPVLVALPAAYYIINNYLLADYAYHAPVSVFDLIISVFVVVSLALLIIGFQTWKIANLNPTHALRSE